MRILLDSNVWRYIHDADALGMVQKVARASRNTIVIAPAVLFEAAHTGDRVLRDALLSAMTLPIWKRLMPEAFSEAEELKSEIRRLRPEWLRARPELGEFRRYRYDWIRSSGGVWDRIHADAEMLQRHDAEMLQRAREQAHDLREDAQSWSPKWRTAKLTKTLGSLPSPLPGWSGQPFEAWRADGLNVFRVAISTPGHPAIDWLAGEINLDLMLSQNSSLVKFWLHDVDTHRMPRHWLRWAFEFLQRLHRVTEGTPVDGQLGTYLLEADLMLSADKIFVSIAERCRTDAPFRIAESKVVPGAAGAIASVLQALK